MTGKISLPCPKCDLEIVFETEPPEYEVGLMGWGAGMVMPNYRECQCEFTEAEQEALEYRAAMAASNYEGIEP